MFFISERVVRGHMTRQFDEPEWSPLLELAPDHIDDFEGRAFAYIWSEGIREEDEPGSYREVDPQRILKEVLRHRQV